MNFSQRLGLTILIIISVLYVYTSFFSKNSNLTEKNNVNKNTVSTQQKQENSTPISENKLSKKVVKIFLIDKDAKIKHVKRTCDPNIEKSCFEFAIKELISAPNKEEKILGYTSEIPQGTKILSIRESSNAIMIDLSSTFESGGGTESTYYRVKQLIKTVIDNSPLLVYLYINGKQANVIGGEGIMIKQPLSMRSLDE